MIIAIVPAPGHEALVADGPFHERPPLVWQDRDGQWHRRTGWSPETLRPLALVLHAPGGPKLGMLRAMEAVGVTQISTMPPVGGVSEMVSHGDWYEVAVEPSPDFGFGAHAQAWSLAHLLVQRGIAAEVIVLPADKAKE